MSRHIGAALAVVAALSVTVAAQPRPQQQPSSPQQSDKQFVDARGSVKPVPLPPGGPPPRMSDGKVDLSGVWFSGPTGKATALVAACAVITYCLTVSVWIVRLASETVREDR